jgi:hypothetical protein
MPSFSQRWHISLSIQCSRGIGVRWVCRPVGLLSTSSARLAASSAMENYRVPALKCRLGSGHWKGTKCKIKTDHSTKTEERGQVPSRGVSALNAASPSCRTQCACQPVVVVDGQGRSDCIEGRASRRRRSRRHARPPKVCQDGFRKPRRCLAVGAFH